MSETKDKKKGFNLYSIFKRTKGFDRTTSEIPAIVSEPILWLKSKNALGEEGIFRIPGSATLIKELKIKYDQGKKVDLFQIEDVHTVAGLLKVFFRELSEPILTFELYNSWLAALKPDDLKIKLEYIKRVLQSLPAGNRIILDTILSFLREVSLHTTNCMGVANLAIVFAPNLMRPREESFESVVAHSSSINTLIMLLIQHYGFLFLDKEYVDEDIDIDAVTLVPIKKPANLKKSKTLSSSGSESEDNKILKKKTSNKTNDLKRSRKASVLNDSSKESLSPPNEKKDSRRNVPLSDSRVKKKNLKDSDFMNTLKSDTLKLMTSLMEEKELTLVLEEEDKLTKEEKLELEKKIKDKINQTKLNKSKARRVRKIQRNHSTNVGVRRTSKKRDGLISTSKEGTKERTKFLTTSSSDIKNAENGKNEDSNSQYGTLSKSSGESSNDTDNEYLPIITEDDIKFEEELDDLLKSVDDDDIEDMKSSLLSSNEISDKEETETETETDDESDLKQKIDNVIDKVLEGDMSAFQKYLGDMGKMQRMQRSKSKKLVYNKINRAN